MDRVTFDFEKEEVTVENQTQIGTFSQPNLKARKEMIMAAAGLEEVDVGEVTTLFEDLFNGKCDAEEFKRRSRKIIEEEERKKKNL